MKKNLLYLVVLCSSLRGQYFDSLSKIIDRFSRPITFLEVGAVEYASVFAEVKSVASCALIAGTRCELSPQLTLLAPDHISLDHLNKLAQCEHIDVVLMHDISRYLRVPLASYVGTVINSGEHVFIEATNPALQKVLASCSVLKKLSDTLFYGYRPKEYLSYARFSARTPSATQYRVVSTYQEKWLMKDGAQQRQPWIPGINLVTFVMLQGRQPTNNSILHQIGFFKKRYRTHTDLVLGNIIVQGESLHPIDDGDGRRSASSKKCLDMALRAFKDKSRFVDPEQWLSRYYHSLVT